MAIAQKSTRRDTARIRWFALEETIDHVRKGFNPSFFFAQSRESVEIFEQGDGGAPLICEADNGEWFLHGISIYGPGCNKRGDGPSVFVRPSVFLTFIEVKFVHF